MATPVTETITVMVSTWLLIKQRRIMERPDPLHQFLKRLRVFHGGVKESDAGIRSMNVADAAEPAESGVLVIPGNAVRGFVPHHAAHEFHGFHLFQPPVDEVSRKHRDPAVRVSPGLPIPLAITLTFVPL